MGSDQTFGVNSSRPLTPAEWDEHAIINGVHGKKVFVVDANGNQVSDGPMALKVTTSGSVTYVGMAAPGSAQSSAVWQCKKIDETTGTVITWADGDANFDNVSTDLTALSYS
jgi:hypothetical protein